MLNQDLERFYREWQLPLRDLAHDADIWPQLMAAVMWADRQQAPTPNRVGWLRMPVRETASCVSLLGYEVSQLDDPEIAVKVAIHQLGLLMDFYQRWYIAIAAYHQGEWLPARLADLLDADTLRYLTEVYLAVGFLMVEEGHLGELPTPWTHDELRQLLEATPGLGEVA